MGVTSFEESSIHEILSEILQKCTPESVIEEIKKIPILYEGFKQDIFQSLTSEVKHICSNSFDSVLRRTDLKSLQTFSFQNVSNEWKQHAPLFYNFIMRSSINQASITWNTQKNESSILCAQVSAGCKLLHVYNRNMGSLLHINDVIFVKGGMKKAGFQRMQSTGDCHSYSAAINFFDNIASSWDTELCSWREQASSDNVIEQQLIQQISYIDDTIDLLINEPTAIVDFVLEKASIENELKKHRSGMHAGYYFISDNVDMVTKVRHMTMHNKYKDQHIFQMCAYKHRVTGNDLHDNAPLQNSETAEFQDLIPGMEEKKRYDRTVFYRCNKNLVQVYSCVAAIFFYTSRLYPASSFTGNQDKIGQGMYLRHRYLIF